MYKSSKNHQKSQIFKLNFSSLLAYFIIVYLKITMNNPTNSEKLSIRHHQLRPNSKPTDPKSQFASNTTNFTSTSHPHTPQQIRERTLSNNDLHNHRNDSIHSKNSQAQIIESQLRSIGPQDTFRTKKQLHRLKERINELESQNMYLHKANIEYESESKIWQDKAKRLNDQLISYENMDLAKPDVTYDMKIFKQQLAQKEEQIRKLKKQKIDLEQIIKGQTSKMAEQTRKWQKSKKDTQRYTEMMANYSRMQQDMIQLQGYMQKLQVKNNKSQLYIQKLQDQLQFMNKGISEQMFIIEEEKINLLKGQNLKLAEILNETKKQMIKYNSQQVLLQATISSLTNKNVELKKDIELLSSQNNDLQVLVDKLKFQIKSNQSNISQKQDKIAGQYMKHTSESKLLNQRITLLQSQLKSTKQSEQLYKVKLESLIVKCNEIESANMILKQQSSKNFNERQESCMMQLEKAQLKLKQMTRDNRNLQIQLRDQSNQIETLEQSLYSQKQIFQKANLQFKIKIQQITTLHFQQIQTYNKRLSQGSELSEMIEKLRRQNQQLFTDAVNSKQGQQRLKRELAILKEDIVSNNNNEFERKLREYEYLIKELTQDNEKWKSYRLSEEDEARREARRHKKKAEQLQILLRDKQVHSQQTIDHETRRYQQQISELQSIIRKIQSQDIKQFEQLQSTCENLKREMQNQEQMFILQLEEEKLNFNQAMDEMEMELRGLLKQCEQKLAIKQKEIDLLTRKLQSVNFDKHQEEKRLSARTQGGQLKRELTNVYSQLKSANNQLSCLRNQNFSLRSDLSAIQNDLKHSSNSVAILQGQIKSLKVELQLSQNELSSTKIQQTNILNQQANSRSEIMRLQSLLRKTQNQNQNIKTTSETHRDIRVRYDKDMHDKVTEIQRLKLEVNYLSEELKKNTNTKKQLENVQLTLRNRQNQQRQTIQRNKYLESMIETYLSEIKTYKTVKEKQAAEKRILQQSLAELNRKIELMEKEHSKKVYNLESQIQIETNHSNRRVEEKSREMQRIVKQWQQKCEHLQAEINENFIKLSHSSTQQKQLQKMVKDQQKIIINLNAKFDQLNSKLLAQSNEQIESYKLKIKSHEQRQISYQNMIEEQKRLIQSLSKEQGDKLHQIQVLLSKINILEAEKSSKNSKSSHQEGVQKQKRLQIYHQITAINLIGDITKFSFDGDQLIFLETVLHTIKVLNSRFIEILDEVSQGKRQITLMAEERECLIDKYLKYKSMVMEYKDRREVQKVVLRNTYRFNQQLLTHCQGIISDTEHFNHTQKLYPRTTNENQRMNAEYAHRPSKSNEKIKTNQQRVISYERR